jgi:alpha-beta hydrolase superfamily lysophospholipase
MEERSFVDGRGVEVFTRWWMIEAPEAVVIISHGASEHSGRYGRFAQALNSAGFAAVALDHRGHGLTASSGRRGVMGPGGGNAVIGDVHELQAAARSATDRRLPAFLFGHSMGSLIALAYLVHHSEDLAGGVLCGFPTEVGKRGALGELLRGFADGDMRDQPVQDLLSNNNIPFEPARTRFDWLSRDNDEVDRYIADPLCGDDNPLTYGYLIDLFDVVAPTREHLDAICCPVLVIAGDHDPAAGMGAHASALAEALKANDVPVDLRLYPDARHELLNETIRDAVTVDIIEWLRSQL